MRLLALSALFPAALAVAIGLMVWTSASPPVLNGQIVMEQASYCDAFVIKTEKGLAIVVDESNWPLVISSGTNVSGLRRERGIQAILVDERAELRVRVILWETDWDLAKRRFEQECDPAAPGRSFKVQSERSPF